MAQGFVQLAADSTGKKIDTQVTTTAAQHRQVMVIGAKDTDANVAPVDATKGLAVDLSATGANSNKLLVTPDLPSGASTAAKQPALGTAGSASSDVITVQGAASMTKILVTPDSVALPAHQSANVDQLNGTTIDTNSGSKSAGTQRVVLATDQPALTNALKVDGSAVTQPVSGTVTANAGTNLNTSSLALDATLTGGTQQSKLTDGTNIVNVLKSDGTVAGQNAQLVAPAVQTLTFTTSTPGAQTILANTDVSHYAWIEIIYTSVGSGLALTGQFSTASGGAYVNQSTFASNTGSPNGALGTTVSTVYTSPVRGNFFQMAVSALTSGTFTGTVTLRTIAPPFITTLVSASQSGTWTVQPGNTANTTAWLTAGGKTNNNAAPGATNLGSLVGVANAAIPSWTEGNEVLLSTDLSGNLRALLLGGLMPTGTALNTYSAQITTNTTTTPTSSTAYISGIVVSVTTAGTTSTVTIKDKQGTPLTLINLLSTAALSAGDTQFTFQTPVKMVSGIDIVTAGAAAATFSIFINYYQ